MQEKKLWLQNALKGDIEAIIFDLGGVIIDIDFNLTLKALEKYTSYQFGEGEYLTKHPIFYEFETGKISENDFFSEIQKTFELNATFTELKQAWNALLLDIPQKRVELLQNLQIQLPTFILSNTNPTHLQEVENILRKQTSTSTLEMLVRKPYYSFELGKAKPERAVYEQVIDENRLKPEKTLFVDDSFRNLEGAKQIGLQIFHIIPFAEDICDFFNERPKK